MVRLNASSLAFAKSLTLLWLADSTASVPVQEAGAALVCNDSQVAVQYTNECSQRCIPQPTCLSCASGIFNDGCNDCRCGGPEGNTSCTEKACLVAGPPYCYDSDCSLVDCQPILDCKEDEIIFTPEGECCPVCQKKKTPCPPCKPGQIEGTRPGKSAPECFDQVSCSTCPSGHFFDGCNTCVCSLSLNATICTKKYCDVSTMSVPSCTPSKCDTVRCQSPPICAQDEIQILPEGECCLTCSRYYQRNAGGVSSSSLTGISATASCFFVAILMNCLAP